MSENKGPKRPTHGAFQVNEGQEGKSHFNRIGSAFEHKDREGFNILLNAVPVDGRITLRTLKDRVQNARDGGGQDRSRGEPEPER